MKQKKPIHLLTRFSDMLLENRSTIEEQQKVIEHDGEVWFGIMGVASPVYPLLETLVKSSSGHFYIQEKSRSYRCLL
jgi:hypothetical protein